jgi:hypothetical protein
MDRTNEPSVACYICGKEGRLLHPDELEIHPTVKSGFILCNYCHQPICLEHISKLRIEKLNRIRPQRFCTRCAETLTQEKRK